MKQLFLLLLFFPFLLFSQVDQKELRPFSALQSDSVVLYDYNKYTRPGASIVIEEEGKKKQLGKFEKKVTLSAKKMQQLTSKVEDPGSYGSNVAACFDPHLGIVYYKKGEIQAYINVCMDCNRLEPSLKLIVQDQGKQTTEEGEVFYTLYGMSKKFKKYLDGLLKQYDFSHRAKWKPTFE